MKTMNKTLASILSVLVIVAFVVFIIIDSANQGSLTINNTVTTDEETIPDSWDIKSEIAVKEGSLKAVAVSQTGDFYTGGDSFISCYDSENRLKWNLKTPYPVTALSTYGDSVFASTHELIMVVSSIGEMKDEWGPFEDNAIITSITSNKSTVAIADAGNRMIFLLDKDGIVKKLIGQDEGQFIIPSPYFDIALNDDNTLFTANTGHRRIETRSENGELKSYFGEPGTAPGAFSGCCNPAHFISIPDGFVTAEKGINRIKILNNKGEFVEYVSGANKFQPAVPLDLASADGKLIFAANPADSKVYIFVRKR
jgi:hypothetical protein